MYPYVIMIHIRIVVVDPSGNVIPGNIVPFTIEGVTTDPASDVNKVPGQAGLNGRICGFSNLTKLTYYFEHSTDCSLNSSVSRTPSNNITATGSCNQTVTPQTVTDLPSGKYCYR